MKKVFVLLIGIGVGLVTAKKIDKLSKKYRLVIKFERKEEGD